MQSNAPEPSGVLLGVEGLVDATRVGQGSYGVVYRASQPAYGRTVAVKLLTSPLLDPDSQRRFERECKALGSLSSHPFIVTLHAAGVTSDGHPYLIMDYLPGGSLAARVSNGPLGWEEVADIGVKLSGALATAHESGVLHRDIKPENVLVSAYGEPQLADFGVAKIQGGTSTSSATITGSLAHAAPEVISGVSATAASDIWSLASTLATLLLGHPPFHRTGDETLHPLITRILTQPPPDMRPMGVPSVICDLIEVSLAKDSWERPQSALEFGHALQDAQRSLGLTPTMMAAFAVPSATATGGIPVVSPGDAPQDSPEAVAESTGGASALATNPPPPEPAPSPETATRKRGALDPVPIAVVADLEETPRQRRFGRQARDNGDPSTTPVPIVATSEAAAVTGRDPVPAAAVVTGRDPVPAPAKPAAAEAAAPAAAAAAGQPVDLTAQSADSSGPLLVRAGRFTSAHRRLLIPIVTVAAVVLGLLLITSHGSGSAANKTPISAVPTTVLQPVGAPPSSDTTSVATTTTAPTADTTTPTTAAPVTAATAAVPEPTVASAGSGGTTAPTPTAPRPTTRATPAPTTKPTVAPTTPTHTTVATTPVTEACPPKVPNCH